MKTCGYCGKQYQDDAVICPVDQQPLALVSGRRNSITGTWRGSYKGPADGERAAVPFTLRLKQGWFGHFTGTVTEDQARGMPGTGSIDGFFGFPQINFVKRMPVCSMGSCDGRWVALREYLLTEGVVYDRQQEHPPVTYEGAFYEADRARGRWIIRPWFAPLPDGGRMPFGEVSGVWTLELEGP